jgi:DNA repair protein RadC
MDLRKMVFESLQKDAAFIVLAHNHPRGKLMASSEDIVLTRDVIYTMNKVGIEVADHVLVANNKCTSIMNATC